MARRGWDSRLAALFSDAINEAIGNGVSEREVLEEASNIATGWKACLEDLDKAPADGPQACDHPRHRNPALLTPCPACGAGKETRP